MSKFQIILLAVFGAFILIGVLLFSFSRGQSTNISLSVWGTLPANDFQNMLIDSGIQKSGSISFTYTAKSPDTFDSDFTEALAEGKGPDLVIISGDDLFSLESKLTLIPNSTVRPADFVSTFIKEGELFQNQDGTYALPMYVDPMVLYTNRDLLSQASLAKPLTYWDEIYSYIDKLRVKDNADNITTAAIALGEAKNIKNAKDILSLLFLQAGTPIVANTGTSERSTLEEGGAGAQSPAMAALDFYTQFANPQKTFDTWNRVLPEAATNFTGGRSAMYLGFASELPVLHAKNPTLDIAVSPVPQSRQSGKTLTIGKIYGVAVTRSAKNLSGAIQGALALISAPALTSLAQKTTLVPARLDLLSNPPADPSAFTFYSAALQAKGWLDPDPAKTQSIFTNMIESVTSGRSRLDEAVRDGSNALDALLNTKP